MTQCPLQLLLFEEALPGEKPTAAVFTPYNITPGEGEKYLLATAEVLIQAGYQVWLVTPEIFSYLRITQIAGILGINLQGLGITTLKAAEAMPRFDIFVAMGNEVVAPVKALGKRNFYYCQFPFRVHRKKSIDAKAGWPSTRRSLFTRTLLKII